MFKVCDDNRQKANTINMRQSNLGKLYLSVSIYIMGLNTSNWYISGCSIKICQLKLQIQHKKMCVALITSFEVSLNNNKCLFCISSHNPDKYMKNITYNILHKY